MPTSSASPRGSNAGAICRSKDVVYDGNTAAAHVAYAVSDTAFIYPITPSTAMSEVCDLWASQGKKNIWDSILTIRQMQSEAGAAGAVHGSLVVGTLTTTFTASQGLLLMIPNMYKIAGELLPSVFHVSARAIAGQALSIFGDHSDVMAVRATGWAILGSSSVQEAHDFAMISHMATLNASVPFVHFFDGFRTSHELQKLEVLEDEAIRSLLNHDAIEKFRSRSLTPTRPCIRGTSQGPEVFFQNVEAANRFYVKVPGIVEKAMAEFGALTGRLHKLYDYVGHPQAEHVIILMGAGAPVVGEVINYLWKRKGERVGYITVHLFRPWVADKFLEEIPKTAEIVTVLDRTKESGAMYEPLCMDVLTSVQMSQRKLEIYGGRYGLGSKDFTPAMVFAVVQNMRSTTPKSQFVVGIEDDVTNLSIDFKPYISIATVPSDIVQCMFWGMGSDGTIGANKNVIKIMGDHTTLNVQGYFAYSAHKAGGLTVSHLRFGTSPITSAYLLQPGQAAYVACHRDTYVKQFEMASYVKEGGAFVLNCAWDDASLDAELPAAFKREIARKKVKLYTVNANKVASEAGMGRRVNNILMTVFFQLSGVLPFEEAIGLFKKAIAKTYGRKGQHVVDANLKAVDMAMDACHPVSYDAAVWLEAPFEKRIEKRKLENAPTFVTQVLLELEKLNGDELPVSAFKPGGVVPLGTAAYEKRGIALKVPVVNMDKCTQCNYCSFVCPHAAIRPFLLDDEEMEGAPETFQTKRAKGANEITPYQYRIQVSPLDCTGCELCSIACPDNCLPMKPLSQAEAVEGINWDFAQSLTQRGELLNNVRGTVKGSQFYQPLLEFSGACEGCGETPYVKLLTQLFGERLIIANATGCSSIWGASYPSIPYTTNNKGYGPAWGNSLFEDAAEYGYGMISAIEHRRHQLKDTVEHYLKQFESKEGAPDRSLGQLEDKLGQWLDVMMTNPNKCQELYEELVPLLEEKKDVDHSILEMWKNKDMFPKLSHWVIGGDGWAYDIGFGGLDHVIACSPNVNILILDTEVYSNTGGQISKATPLGAVHKFGYGGNLRNKKDMGMIAMDYGNVYVASVCSSANMTQTVRAFVEAEAYPGPSVILAYAPCIEHGYIKPFSAQQLHCKLAVESGYWPLYRNNPMLEPALQMDVKKIRTEVKEFLARENRFEQLRKSNPKLAAELEIEMSKWIKRRWAALRAKAEGYIHPDVKAAAKGKPITEEMWTILYGSETGNAEGVAYQIAAQMKERGMFPKVYALNEIDAEDLATSCHKCLIVISTAGQGELPANAKEFWAQLSSESTPADIFKTLRFAVFGLGDTAYIFFNKAAKEFDAKFEELGATRLMPVGLGDDQADEKYDTALSDWLSDFWVETKAPEPLTSQSGPPEASYVLTNQDEEGEYTQCVPYGAKLIRLATSKRLTPEDYDVEVRHLEFDLKDSGFRYGLGDSLAIYPHNDPEKVLEVCHWFGFRQRQWLRIARRDPAEGDVRRDAMFSRSMTIRQLFTECLDLFGRPTRRFYELLPKYCGHDEKDRAAAKAILHPDNKDSFVAMVNEDMVSYFDVLKRFKSLRGKLTIGQLIDLVPLIKPRHYSIASSQKFVGNDSLHLCIGTVEWFTSNSEHRFGTCTGYLHNLRPEGAVAPIYIAASLKATTFNLPPNDSYPILCAGMGTGLAPFRAFYQYRCFLKRNNKPCGPLTLYFGCRYSKKDFLYGEEMKGLEAEGVITELKVAFSRDQKEKFYVQNSIDQDPETFYRRFIKEKGYFYLCGQAKQVPIDIRAAVCRALVSQGGMTEAQADQHLTEFQIQGRYNVEAW